MGAQKNYAKITVRTTTLDRMRRIRERTGETYAEIIERALDALEASERARAQSAHARDRTADSPASARPGSDRWPPHARDRFEPLPHLYFSMKYAKKHPGRLLKRVERENVVGVLTRGGRPVCAMVPTWYYEQLTGDRL